MGHVTTCLSNMNMGRGNLADSSLSEFTPTKHPFLQALCCPHIPFFKITQSNKQLSFYQNSIKQTLSLSLSEASKIPQFDSHHLSSFLNYWAKVYRPMWGNMASHGWVPEIPYTPPTETSFSFACFKPSQFLCSFGFSLPDLEMYVHYQLLCACGFNNCKKRRISIFFSFSFT